MCQIRNNGNVSSVEVPFNDDLLPKSNLWRLNTFPSLSQFPSTFYWSWNLPSTPSFTLFHSYKWCNGKNCNHFILFNFSCILIAKRWSQLARGKQTKKLLPLLIFYLFGSKIFLKFENFVKILFRLHSFFNWCRLVFFFEKKLN